MVFSDTGIFLHQCIWYMSIQYVYTVCIYVWIYYCMLAIVYVLYGCISTVFKYIYYIYICICCNNMLVCTYVSAYEYILYIRINVLLRVVSVSKCP